MRCRCFGLCCINVEEDDGCDVEVDVDATAAADDGAGTVVVATAGAAFASGRARLSGDVVKLSPSDSVVIDDTTDTGVDTGDGESALLSLLPLVLLGMVGRAGRAQWLSQTENLVEHRGQCPIEENQAGT